MVFFYSAASNLQMTRERFPCRLIVFILIWCPSVKPESQSDLPWWRRYVNQTAIFINRNPDVRFIPDDAFVQNPSLNVCISVTSHRYHGISDHRQLLSNSIYRVTITIPLWPESTGYALLTLNKGLVMRKAFPCHNLIMHIYIYTYIYKEKTVMTVSYL